MSAVPLPTLNNARGSWATTDLSEAPHTAEVADIRRDAGVENRPLEDARRRRLTDDEGETGTVP